MSCPVDFGSLSRQLRGAEVITLAQVHAGKIRHDEQRVWVVGALHPLSEFVKFVKAKGTVDAAMLIAEFNGRQFDGRNLRHSLASFLVSVGTNPKVVQGLLRHSNVRTTLQLYTQSVNAERLREQCSMRWVFDRS